LERKLEEMIENIEIVIISETGKSSDRKCLGMKMYNYENTELSKCWNWWLSFVQIMNKRHQIQGQKDLN